MNKKIKYIILLVIIFFIFVPAYMAFAEGGLLSAGGAQVTAGEGYTFKLNLDSFKQEYEDAQKPYTVTVNISPNPESISISPVVNVQQCGGKLIFSSADLSAVSTIDITVYPGKQIMQETTYTVTTNVAGDLSTPSDTISFKAVPAQEKKDDPTQDPNQQTDQKQGMAKAGKAASGGGATSVDSSLVYAGSWDNYLKSLSVDGYEFTHEFNKTRDTYFVKVPDGVESLDVSATASDSSASVRIAGADNVAEDMSKIMINVTADNGEVRTYRIYVTHTTEEQ